MATYSNGQTKAVGQVALAQFNAANALKRGNGSTFEETLEFGKPDPQRQRHVANLGVRWKAPTRTSPRNSPR